MMAEAWAMAVLPLEGAPGDEIRELPDDDDDDDEEEEERS